jgi:hypothetical protein
MFGEIGTPWLVLEERLAWRIYWCFNEEGTTPLALRSASALRAKMRGRVAFVGSRGVGQVRNSIVEGIISLLVGGLSIFFRNRFAHEIVEFQKTVWGFKFGEREVIASRIGIIIVGSCFIITGILSLFGIIKFR